MRSKLRQIIRAERNRHRAVRQDNYIGFGLAALWGGAGIYTEFFDPTGEGGVGLIVLGVFFVIFTVLTWKTPKVPKHLKAYVGASLVIDKLQGTGLDQEADEILGILKSIDSPEAPDA